MKTFDCKFENSSFTKLLKILKRHYILIKLSSTWNEEKITSFFKSELLNFLLIFIISFYLEEVYSDTEPF